jgi:hypothetical protein
MYVQLPAAVNLSHYFIYFQVMLLKTLKTFRFCQKTKNVAINLGTPKCKISLRVFVFTYIIYIITVYLYSVLFLMF